MRCALTQTQTQPPVQADAIVRLRPPSGHAVMGGGCEISLVSTCVHCVHLLHLAGFEVRVVALREGQAPITLFRDEYLNVAGPILCAATNNATLPPTPPRLPWIDGEKGPTPEAPVAALRPGPGHPTARPPAGGRATHPATHQSNTARGDQMDRRTALRTMYGTDAAIVELALNALRRVPQTKVEQGRRIAAQAHADVRDDRDAGYPESRGLEVLAQLSLQLREVRELDAELRELDDADGEE